MVSFSSPLFIEIVTLDFADQVFTMLMTLQLNNVKINYSQAELISLGLSVAEGKTEYVEILEWIMEHKI